MVPSTMVTNCWLNLLATIKAPQKEITHQTVGEPNHFRIIQERRTLIGRRRFALIVNEKAILLVIVLLRVYSSALLNRLQLKMLQLIHSLLDLVTPITWTHVVPGGTILPSGGAWEIWDVDSE